MNNILESVSKTYLGNLAVISPETLICGPSIDAI